MRAPDLENNWREPWVAGWGGVEGGRVASQPNPSKQLPRWWLVGRFQGSCDSCNSWRCNRGDIDSQHRILNLALQGNHVTAVFCNFPLKGWNPRNKSLGLTKWKLINQIFLLQMKILILHLLRPNFFITDGKNLYLGWQHCRAADRGRMGDPAIQFAIVFRIRPYLH